MESDYFRRRAIWSLRSQDSSVAPPLETDFMPWAGGERAGAAIVSYQPDCPADFIAFRHASNLCIKTVGLLAFALLVCVVRGPREKRWLGWSGGWDIRKNDGIETQAHTQPPMEARTEARDLEDSHAQSVSSSHQAGSPEPRDSRLGS